MNTSRHPPPPLLRIEQVHKSYATDTAGSTREVLRGVDLTIAPGETLAVVGPSGCGKSTLLNCIGGLDRPDSGRIIFNGQDLAEMNDAATAALRNRDLGFVFQDHHLLPQCTVRENILLPRLALQSRASEEEAAHAVALLQRVGLGDRGHDFPSKLSGGERQRIAVVRALVHRPKLLLADEPTGALDEDSARGLVELLCEFNQEDGVTVVMVTHAPQLAAMMTRRVHLHQGQLKSET